MDLLWFRVTVKTSVNLLSKTALCCVLLTASAAAQTVEGIVVDTATGSGIAAARVFLMPASPEPENFYNATADALGHFRFEGVKAGSYHLGFASPGYVPSDPMAGVREVQVSGDGNTIKLEGRMSAQPRISGRVVDGDGKGVANALLQIVGREDPPVTTDTTGKFELRPDPGAYILSVLPPTDLKPPVPERGSDQQLMWTRVFYPGVTSLNAASRIVLRPGGDASGIVIKLPAVPSHAVRGVLLDLDGTPVSGATVTLGEQQDPTTGHSMFKRDPARTLRAETNSDGAFDFPQVADGEWRLAAEVESGGAKRRATQWIDVTGHELEGVKLHLALPFTLRGKVVMETPKGTSAPDAFPIFIAPHGLPVRSDPGRSNWMLYTDLHFEPPIPRNAPDAAEARRATEGIKADEFPDELGALLATPDADGNFSLKNVYPGSYRIASMTPPPPYYIRAIRIGDADLTTAETDLSSGAAPITIVYRTDGGTVHGTAEKCAGGLVLLIPQDSALQSFPFFRTGRCDASDRYEILAVRPGDYYALAFEGPGGVPQLDDNLIGQTNVCFRQACMKSIPRNW
jgi:Carboxypeptidase regulatory-like domain